MLFVFAIILTSISIISTPIFIWLMFKDDDEFTIFDIDDAKRNAPIVIFGWFSTASFLFALIIWVIIGISEYRAPIPKLSESLSSLETTLRETETAMARLKGQAVGAEGSVKKYENLSAKTAAELDSLQSALDVAKKEQSQIRKILMWQPWGERLWSFTLGVLSSLIATFVWRCVYRFMKPKTPI